MWYHLSLLCQYVHVNGQNCTYRKISIFLRRKCIFTSVLRLVHIYRTLLAKYEVCTLVRSEDLGKTSHSNRDEGFLRFPLPVQNPISLRSGDFFPSPIVLLCLQKNLALSITLSTLFNSGGQNHLVTTDRRKNLSNGTCLTVPSIVHLKNSTNASFFIRNQ